MQCGRLATREAHRPDVAVLACSSSVAKACKVTSRHVLEAVLELKRSAFALLTFSCVATRFPPGSLALVASVL